MESSNIEKTVEIPALPEKITAEYILAKIEQLQADSDRFYSKISGESLSTMSDTGLSELNDIIKCRETTNQMLIAFYQKVYDDIKPLKKTAKCNDEFVRQFEEKAAKCDAKYNDESVRQFEEKAAKCDAKKVGGTAVNIEDADGDDPKLREAVELAIEIGKISTSLMQRHLDVGYGRAAKIIDQMEQLGYISAADGNNPRKVLITKKQFMKKS